MSKSTYMVSPVLKYCYFRFDGPNDVKHELRMWVTASLSLEWKLYEKDEEIGRYLDLSTNILIPADFEYAMSWPNVVIVYNTLLNKTTEP